MHLTVQSVVESLGRKAGASFDLVMPDGTRYRSTDSAAQFSVVVRNERALLAGFARGHIGLLEAWFDGDLDVEGDLGLLLRAGMKSGLDLQFRAIGKVENDLLEWRRSNRSIGQARENARAHYGLPADFYRLWLDDPLMMYTCGYWSPGTTTLEQAQRNKIDHVARKIRLSAGERFVDIGCGFGGFMFRALEQFGAQGVGVNTTPEQVDWLRERIAARGLADSLQVRQADFREVDATYDKVVSIGVLEHAGRDQLAEVIRAHADFLKPGGLGMLHFIGHVGRFDTEIFIRKHVFPGGWIPSLAEVIVEMERCGLEIVDIENLRRHYALTLDEWALRFQREWPSIQAIDRGRFDERFRRIWLTYLIGCAEMFRSAEGYTHLFQIVFSKGNISSDSYPMSRAFLHGD
jgi:cyclopropane-fatty-acyl-phospholipid synthase